MEVVDCLVVRGARVVSPLMGTADVDDSELYASAIARVGELTAAGGVPALVVVAEEAALVFFFFDFLDFGAGEGWTGWRASNWPGIASCKTVGGVEGTEAFDAAAAEFLSLFFPLAFPLPFPFSFSVCCVSTRPPLIWVYPSPKAPATTRAVSAASPDNKLCEEPIFAVNERRYDSRPRVRMWCRVLNNF